MPALYLASASPRRRDLLGAAGFRFASLAVVVAESHALFLTVPELVLLNARRKGRAALAAHARDLPADAVIVTADTLVALDGEALGKPRDHDEASGMLQRLAGRTHQVYTGVAFTRPSVGSHAQNAAFIERTDVTFRPLDARAIRAYLARIDPLDKAGAYAAQEHGSDIIAATAGSWTNVLGLPMETLTAALARLGILPEPAAPALTPGVVE
ncbi:MAG: septum formation protein Maf [Verrucomicrobia bacterium]|nr:septum formation protein Maf [Verrucomicrobiota bacterium]